ncbi:MAG: hypothetical protein N3D16_06490 [Anaerolineales bacterium]|nr:hypothetical protein [Anaerolineales bacterium]
MKTMRIFHFTAWIILLAILSLACALSGGGGSNAQATAEALAIQSTALALQMTQQAQQLQNTLTAQTGTTLQPPSRPATLEELRKNARILLHEDILNSQANLERYIKRALDDGGYTYLDTEGNTDRLKENVLFGTTTWDLIIISAEASGHIPADYFEFLVAHLQRETALILEMWDMDDILLGKIEAVPKMKWILDTCGIEFHTDWYNPNTRQVFLLQPQHPLLNQPNRISQLDRCGRCLARRHWRLDEDQTGKQPNCRRCDFLGGADPSECQSKRAVSNLRGGPCGHSDLRLARIQSRADD